MRAMRDPAIRLRGSRLVMGDLSLHFHVDALEVDLDPRPSYCTGADLGPWPSAPDPSVTFLLSGNTYPPEFSPTLQRNRRKTLLTFSELLLYRSRILAA